MYHYYQIEGGEEPWKPVQAEYLQRILEDKKPMFVTVLATDKLVSRETPRDDRLALRYLGPLYFDFDSTDLEESLSGLRGLLDKLGSMQFNWDWAKIYATGSKGFHVEIPMECFIPKVDRRGYAYLPLIYKAMALKLAEDCMDFRVYSIGMGRMWRQPGVQRPNGKYKVRIDPAQLAELTAERTQELTSQPEGYSGGATPDFCIDLGILFDRCQQEITDRLKGQKRRKPVESAVFTRPMPSMRFLMEGRGIKPGVGFNQLAMQIAIYAREAGIDEDDLVKRCGGLFEVHQSNGTRYNTVAKREEEVRRMCRVVADDPCYEYVPAAVRALLTHEAPDLEGVPVDAAEIEEDISSSDSSLPWAEGNEGETATSAPGGPSVPVDEYEDVARGVDMSKYGVYAETEFGKRRITSLGFKDVKILRSMETNKIACLDATVTVNGKVVGRETIEPDTITTVAGWNKFASRFGHAFQGTEAQARAAYMRSIEKGRKDGSETYVHEREGLALVNIPHHDNEELRKPFLLWSDGKAVVTEPRVKACSDLTISFQGHPDPRGVYRCDLMDAPSLAEWAKDPVNLLDLKDGLLNLFRCQKGDVIGTMLGWLTACFYKPLFQKAYNQFPLLHINGPAGNGKSQISSTLARMFYYNQEPKTVSPSSTVFALSQFATGTDSIPMIVDEYKPNEMAQGVHDRLKLMFRDAYNARDIQRGGGNRDNDNFKALTTTSLCAPIMFIAESIEEETALMERVVLVTLESPSPAVRNRFASRFMIFRSKAQALGVLGKYIASRMVMEGYNVERLKAEFDPLYNEARKRLMLTEEDLANGLSDEEMQAKQQARERPVFNFTVARFGLLKFKELIESLFGEKEFKIDFDDFLDHSYTRLKDLIYTSLPEYLKVLNTMVDLSYEDQTAAHALRYGIEYGFDSMGGKDTLEISVRAAYSRYRQACRIQAVKPLYSGDHAFAHSLRGAPALLRVGQGKTVQAPGGVFIFDIEELTRSGLRPFRAPTASRR